MLYFISETSTDIKIKKIRKKKKKKDEYGYKNDYELQIVFLVLMKSLKHLI